MAGLVFTVAAAAGTLAADRAGATSPGPFDPRGRIHIPIGVPDTLDTLKTFVEAEGNFSPGVGSYGIYFWLFDKTTARLFSPTMADVPCEHGLAEGGLLIPWSVWLAGNATVKTEVCQVKRCSPFGEVHIVGVRAMVTNAPEKAIRVSLYAALRPLGPAGFEVAGLAVSQQGDALLADGHPALVAEQPPTSSGVLPSDTVGEFAMRGQTPPDTSAVSESGDCSGALRFDLTIPAGETRTIRVVCPVLPGRRAARHQWADLGQNALVDVAELNPPRGGVLQPDPGLAYYRSIKTDELFSEAVGYWKETVGRVGVEVPDSRWGESLAAILSHASLCMNDGAPDVAVVNYNVFNRDGVYVANMMQKAGVYELAEKALDYFLSHPFNGRAYPEADNPGQILWCLGEHWRFTRDEQWLRRIYPSARKIAALITYYRTTDGPHWVNTESLDFGSSLPGEKRQELKPGRCDGHHPEYTEAFDIAGLRAAAVLAQALRRTDDAAEWTKLADSLFQSYDERFGKQLGRDYGSFSVLWPCRLYRLNEGKAHDQFKNIGGRNPDGWRYFPLATAHQGLLAGNREAGYVTIDRHLDHEQMRGWYAFEEGGGSSSGGWHRLRTTWTRSVDRPGDNRSVAMPHGWAIAEFWLLLRDCLVFKDGQRLVLLSGIPEDWFRDKRGIAVHNFPTHFGKLTLRWIPSNAGAMLEIGHEARPPEGFVLRLPRSLEAKVAVAGQTAETVGDGDFILSEGTEEAKILFGR